MQVTNDFIPANLCDAEVVADSISEDGYRVTTFNVTMHRFVLAEFNTHRVFCLAGDAELEFDLPAGQSSGRRVHRMTIAEFVDKWHNGARRKGANPKRKLIPLEEHLFYTAAEASAVTGYSKSAIDKACRDRRIPGAYKGLNGSWRFKGLHFNLWRGTAPEHTRFDMQDRLSQMAIRQLNEDTGTIETSSVVDAFFSGEKEVFEIRAGEFSVAGSKDHRVLTASGWKVIGEITTGDQLVVRKFGVLDHERADANRLKKINGQWRSIWQRDVRAELLKSVGKCEKCESTENLQIHHVTPVHEDPSLAFDRDNVLLLCEGCHNASHSTQGWQVSQYLYGALAEVEEVVSRGVEPTYDLTIAGPYPNFLANGVVVHNSRNSASSRAIPVAKRMEEFENSPAWPLTLPAEQPGMQGGSDLTGQAWEDAKLFLIRHHMHTVNDIKDYMLSHPDPSERLHKSVLARYMEPFLWHRVIVTATDWDGYWAQRISELAQPEIHYPSFLMKEAYDASTPVPLANGEWHLPWVSQQELEEFSIEDCVKLSTARCARVSYLTHDGEYDPEKDIALWDRLTTADPAHASPLEHPCKADPKNYRVASWQTWDGRGIMKELPVVGNFLGFMQARHLVLGF